MRVAIDERFRDGYSEMLDDESGLSISGVLAHTIAWYAAQRAHIARLLTDMGSPVAGVGWRHS